MQFAVFIKISHYCRLVCQAHVFVLFLTSQSKSLAMFDINDYPMSAEDRQVFDRLFEHFVKNPFWATVPTPLPCSPLVRNVLTIALRDTGIALAAEPAQATQPDQPYQPAQPAQLAVPAEPYLPHQHNQPTQPSALAQLHYLAQMAQVAQLAQHDPLAAASTHNQQNLTLPWPNPIIPYQGVPMSSANTRSPGTSMSVPQLPGQTMLPSAQGGYGLLPLNLNKFSEKKERRIRIHFTYKEKEYMEEIFKKTTNPDHNLQEQIAQELGLDTYNVKVSSSCYSLLCGACLVVF